LIISAWDDDTIRAFLPESGKLKWKIEHAHNKGVTALAITNDCRRLITGGGDGQVRVWALNAQTQQLLETLKEHKGRITDIQIRHNDAECATSSEDGSCIVWDLTRFVRNQILFASAKFSQIRYRPDEAQLLTCGTDRKVHYWEAFDGSLIRELEISASGALYALDISADGQHFVTGGQDKILKFVSYAEGDTVAVGTGHGGDITKAVICPAHKYIISVTANGSIFVWHYPL
jgi:WD40 repeat protein